MFSGIVETQVRVLEARGHAAVEGGLVQIELTRPPEFDDLHIGDSVAVNGVCLTVESFDTHRMLFALGHETLKVTGWTVESLKGAALNVERSLRLGDRIHGHMVSGHVDATGVVESFKDLGGSFDLQVRCPEILLPYVWVKGSWAVNGVSLTVNEVSGSTVSMCLIPETLKRTNLAALKTGAAVNLEIDMVARGLVHYLASFSTTQKVAPGRMP